MRILVTGGCGFVGSNLAVYLKQKYPSYQITCLDNLKRRGAEFNILRLKEHNINFVHGDIRNPEDLDNLGEFEILLECSAEPSVHAGYGGSPAYLINTNLLGTINCLELARKSKSKIIFLSTSRVYPIASLRTLALTEMDTRLDIPQGTQGQGWSHLGINEKFSLESMRSLYGTTKLCSELMLEEYAFAYGIQYVINRCGVIAGAWQMGKVDQGFMTLWTAKHLYKNSSLNYMGFGGKGKQLRDILNIDDLCELIDLQINSFEKIQGCIFNAGGGAENSISLLELTNKCQKLTNNSLKIGSVPDTNPFDIPYYVTDNSYISSKLGWQPKRSTDDTISSIRDWILDNYEDLKPILS